MKAILFDLDGTLVETKNEVHFQTFNQAIEEIAGLEYTITESEHLSLYDGKQTKEKLRLLTENKGLLVGYHQQIWCRKQELTKELILKIEKSDRLVEIFAALKENGLKIACCSNAIRDTIEISLDKLGVLPYFDLVVSNQDVLSGKPHPEIFWRAMMEFKVLPEECLIVEDAPPGILAGQRSGARVMRVKNSNSYGLKEIQENLNMNKTEKVKWADPKMNVLVLMAGKGSRFAEKGYSLPKWAIDIEGQPMIKRVIDCLGVDANYVFVVLKEHREKYSVDSMLGMMCPGCQVVEVDHVTEGAACSALLAKNLINNENGLLIVNSDQIVEYSSVEFFYKMQEQDLDGGVLTFTAISPKWSFIKNDSDGFICEVAEKNPISDRATVGIYYWKQGRDFVWAAEKMIAENKRTKGEFYVFPATQEAINEGFKFKEFPVNSMFGVGVPEDLEAYLNRAK